MNGFFRARVLDNNDPNKLGRIKVEVYPIMLSKETARTLEWNTEGIDVDVLPWAVPAFPLFDGAGNGSGFFGVPKINSFVFVFFENEDIYQPVYFAEATDGVHGLPTERLENYPDKKVWKTENGIVISINDAKGNEEIIVSHPKNTSLKIDKDGNIFVSCVEDVKIGVTGNVEVTAKGAVSITGSEINLN